MKQESILGYICQYAKEQPDTLAVCELRKKVTYEEYWHLIKKMAAVLQKQGIKKGDHVLLKCTQNINYLVIFSALQYIRALVIPVEKGTKPERINRNCQMVDAAV